LEVSAEPFDVFNVEAAAVVPRHGPGAVHPYLVDTQDGDVTKTNGQISHDSTVGFHRGSLF